MKLYMPEYVTGRASSNVMAEVGIGEVSLATARKWIAEGFWLGFRGCVGLEYLTDNELFNLYFNGGENAAFAYRALRNFTECEIASPTVASVNPDFWDLFPAGTVLPERPEGVYGCYRLWE